MLTSDIAIDKPEDDLLNRKAFVQNMTETILRWDRSESIVLALYGPWGSGKTSTINMIFNTIVERTIKFEKEKKPIIVWFNPWNIANKDQMMVALYKQLLLEIKNAEPEKNIEDFWEKLISISDNFGALEEIPKIGPYVKLTRSLLKWKNGEKTIRRQKEEIDGLFKKLGRRIIIIVDDIDRLETDEIRLLFQIIKINADFPNTIFLTAFDRKVVECALTVNEVSGRDYLEKIVQVGINLPAIEQEEIQNVLGENLDHLIRSHNLQVDSDRFYRFLRLEAFDIFETLRSVKRYINGLEMTIKLIVGELDLIDFLGIELIRVFLPNLYQFLLDNKIMIFIESQSVSTEPTEIDNYRNQLQKAWNSDGEEKAKISKELTLFLFPQLARIFKGPFYAPDYIVDWRKNKRICSPDFFDIYFLFRVPSKNISQFEINKFIDEINDSGHLGENIDNYIRLGKYRKLIRCIEDRIEDISDEHKKTLIGVFLNKIDSLEDTYEQFFGIGSDQAQFLLILKILSNVDEHERFSWLKNFIGEGFPIFPIVSIIDRALADEAKKSPDRLFSMEHIDTLQTLLVDKIYEKAMDYSLLAHKGTAFVLGLWRAWETNEERIKELIKLILSDLDHLLSFCQIYQYEERSDEDTRIIEKKIAIKSILKFLEEETIVQKLEEFSKDDLTELSDDRLETLQLLKKTLSNDKFPTLS